MVNTIMVNMAGFNIAKSPNALATMGIGSCVAVCLYDQANKIGGLAHIMLPYNTTKDKLLCGKYADTGIDALVRLLNKNGAGRLSAKIVGGASIFTPTQQAVITVGKDNIESVKRILADRGIRIVAEDIGGSVGRSVVFYTETGIVEVTMSAQPPKRITLR